jgi:uncharacterized damage-inducible protein DinB
MVSGPAQSVDWSPPSRAKGLLHHIILANRFWFSLILGRSFAREAESKIPDSLETVVNLYLETHTEELEWLTHLQDSDLAAALVTPFIPGRTFSVAEAVLQVCMHSHGHRAQCATRLRILGGTPPASDFVLWLRDRPTLAGKHHGPFVR